MRLEVREGGGGSEVGEAARTTRETKNQQEEGGRACSWEAATTQWKAWPPNVVTNGCQGHLCSTGIRWGVPPAAQLGCQNGETRSPPTAYREGGDGGWNKRPEPTLAAATLPLVPKTPCPFCMLKLSMKEHRLPHQRHAPDRHRFPGCGTHYDSRGPSVVWNVPRRSCTQRASSRALEASTWFVSGARPSPHRRDPCSAVEARPLDCWWEEGIPKGPLQGSLARCKEPLTKPDGQPPCSADHPGHHTGAHSTCITHKGALASRKVHATHNHQGACHAHMRPTDWWGVHAPCARQHGGEACGGLPGCRMEVERLGCMHMEKRRGMGWTT